MSDDPRLILKERRALREVQKTVVSAATIWQISIRCTLGNLRVSVKPQKYAVAADYIPLFITWSHTETAGTLPEFHADSFELLLRFRTKRTINSIGLEI